MQIIREVEQHALAIRDDTPDATFTMPLDEPAPDIDLGMERPALHPALQAQDCRPARSRKAIRDIAADALFEQVYVDKQRLGMNIRRTLQTTEPDFPGRTGGGHPDRARPGRTHRLSEPRRR